jgi:hypothetical protein
LTTKRTLAQAAATLTSLAAGLAGAVAVGTAPAHAAVRSSDYGFQTLAYATLVQGNGPGVQSGRTAFSWLDCTRLTGLNPSNTRSAHEDIAGIDLPADDPQVQVGAATSTSRTYRKDGTVGTVSTNKIAKVVLGGTAAKITITGLTTEARAWAAKNGKLGSSATAHGGVSLQGATGNPQLDAALAQASNPLSDLLGNIPLDGQSIPGLGTIYVSHTYHGVHETYANSNATVLRIVLEGGDTTVTVGRSWARINRDMPAGVFQGSGYGVDIPKVAGGVAHVGRLANQPIGCQGTHGRVRENDLAGFDPGHTGQLEIDAISGQAWGVQKRTGYAKAWTQGRVAKLVLGPLTVEGVVGKATVTQTSSGKIRKSATFSIGRLLQDGKEQGAIPDPGQDIVIGDGNGHDLAKLRFGVKRQTRRAIAITALRIELLEGLDGAPIGTVIRLGNARTAIKRY